MLSPLTAIRSPSIATGLLSYSVANWFSVSVWLRGEEKERKLGARSTNIIGHKDTGIIRTVNLVDCVRVEGYCANILQDVVVASSNGLCVGFSIVKWSGNVALYLAICQIGDPV